MEKQTILCTALPHGRATDGGLRLSVYISPRLWSDDATVAKLPLSSFPDLLAWPATIAAANWSVTFEGHAAVGAIVESAPPRADLWEALFKTDTDVVPFRFEDRSDSVIETIESSAIHDVLSGLYARAATDATYGAGRDLPPAEILALDPDLSDIARPNQPEVSPQPGPRPPPVDLGGTPPQPEPEPSPGPGKPTGCASWCRCICRLLGWLAKPFPTLEAWVDWLCGAMQSDEPPPEETGPTSWPLPTAGVPPGSPPVIASGPPAQPPVVVVPGPPSAKKIAFDELVAFVTPWSAGSAPLPTAAQLEAIYDFHSMIATLGDYRQLLRMLGLVVDLRIDPAVSPVAAGTVKAEPALGLATPTTVAAPRTHYTLDDTHFLAAPRASNPEISNGLLRLNDTTLFQVIQADVVGGGVKVQNAATNMMVVAAKTDRAPNMPDNSGLPALRTAGVAVVRRDLKSELQGTFRRARAMQAMLSGLDGSPAPVTGSGPPPAPTDELFAEDLVRGYRVDVFDSKSNAWHSLCRRKGTYDFLAAPAAPGGKISFSEDDEGFVQFGAVSPLTPTPTNTLRTTDSLFVWNGWSLCAPRPGLSIMPKDQPDGSATLDTPKNEAATKFKLEVNFKPKAGTLPRLRFDYDYRLRVRICDLAGNSVFGPDDAAFLVDAPEQTPPFPCARFEPVSPPAMMLRAEPIEGESLERMVVRTPAVGGETQATERHIIPPKVSQLMAEQYGKFDGAPRMDGTLGGYNLAKRESGALTDAAVEVKKNVWVHTGAQFALTYLPDPASRGALLLGLPGLGPDDVIEPTPAKIVNKIPFEGTWPDPAPFRLRLTAIPAGAVPAEPQWDAVDRVLTVQLPAAGKQVVRMNSYFDASDFARQGVAQWTKDAAPAAFAKAQADAVAGRSWLHLPWRDISLIHAVQAPLAPSTITALTADKTLDKTFATLGGTVASHAASTGKVDVLATWDDPIDDPAQPAPGTRRSKAHICELLIPENAATVSLPAGPSPPQASHEFGDTKFHAVTYRTVATTRFREYFPASITSDPANISLANPVGINASILNSARPDVPRVLYVVPTYGWEAAPAGPGKTTRRRKGGGLRVYLERPWYSSGAGELLGVVFLPDVKFSAISKADRALITQWAADPTWLSAAADDMARLINFKAWAAKGDGLSLAETGLAVSVAGYPVEFDAARRLWFADIEMDVGPSYAPFVRLALARFQPNSVNGAHLSRIVRADFAQLAADRTASYAVNKTASDAKIDIVVKGPTYTASDATAVAGSKGLAEIEARLQKRNPAFGSDAELGWDTVVTELLTPSASVPGAWQGTVSSTAPLTPGEFRILLLEYEWYRTDFEHVRGREGAPLMRRVVYADALGLG